VATGVRNLVVVKDVTAIMLQVLSLLNGSARVVLLLPDVHNGMDKEREGSERRRAGWQMSGENEDGAPNAC
jgi:hypothetical protein